MSYIDIALLVVVALFALIGFILGFGKTMSKLFGWIMSILIVLIITDLIVNLLLTNQRVIELIAGNANSSKSSLFKWVMAKIPQELRDIPMSEVSQIYLTSGSNGVSKIINDKGGAVFSILAPILVNYVINPIYLASGMATMGEVIAAQLSLLILSVIVGAILFLLIRIIMAIIAKVIRNASGEGKSLFSRLGGFLVGAVRGGMYCVLLLLTLNMVMGAGIEQLKVLDEQVENSVFSKDVIEMVDDVSDKIVESNKANDNVKKMIKLVGYENGSDEEIKLWEEIIRLTNESAFEDVFGEN